MINVKGSKSKAGKNPVEVYVSNALEKKKPTLLGGIPAIMFAPLILYLSKLFARGNQADDETANTEEQATGPLAGVPLIQSASDASEHGQTEDAPFGIPEVSDTISFAQPAPSVILPVFRPSAFVGGQANVNAGPGSRDGNAGGSLPLAVVSPLVPVLPSAGGPPNASSLRPDESDVGDTPDSGDDDAPDDEGDDPKPGNRAPVISSPVYLPDVFGCAVVTIGLRDLLRHATDPDGDVLAVKDVSVSSGTLSLQGGTWTFLADGAGPVTVSYGITDGNVAVAQTAQFEVHRALPITGASDDDLLIGTSCGDDIDGRAGNDNIDGRAGDDMIDGGAGDDHIVADAGNDVVRGRSGDDMMFGGAGDDHLSGGAGNDRIYGGSGDDMIFGDSGNDFVDAGDGDDVVLAGTGNDVVLGGAGDDVISDGSGADIIDGGAGADHVVAAHDNADDDYDGGSGHDTMDYSDAKESIWLDLAERTARGSEIGHDDVQGFEVIMTGSGDDTVVFGDRSVTVVGGDGRNTFDFSKMPLPSGDSVSTSHEIADFKVGDRIRESAEKMYEDVFERIKDEFERIYDTEINLDLIPIRYTHGNFNEITRGRVEVDVGGNGDYELAITLNTGQATLLLETA